MRKTPEQILGLEIKRRRARLKISQEELGFEADVHRTYVSQLERGLKSPTLTVILRIAKALDTAAATLVSAVEQQLP